ncbi:hypothetical protein ABFS82_13G117700 [Erythranthe guttata]|uniref:Uncharacterized protein n=1 Tax=Erythranthe guttata TaxID=4155 RepID=A0A022QN06_ERYGU|nr:PREDICTED: uncharacterized protein LOC105968828 [Erythranthe guttata]EYU27860.1 hypothetical protein MIMGU_mgv1a008660mg [Erythranthe guttata]|eukprot:XP_012848953.1 PREDICTED: uncharacterized protein LOC105968828 [Erythranthe guttata]
MAFYGYTGTGSNYNYDFAPAPSEASSLYFSPYEYGEPAFLEYKSSAYYYRDDDDSFADPELNYSVYTSSEPQALRYDPIEYNYSHYSVNPSHYSYIEPKLLTYEPPPYETKFFISYSKQEFNEPEFEEYDPTPYGGGYDPVATYGKPLPPSETTCYPRSVPRSDATSSLENFSYSSIPSPYGKDDEDIDLPKKPQNGAKPIDTKIVENSMAKDDEDIDLPKKRQNGGKPIDTKIVEIVVDDLMAEGDENGVEEKRRGDYYGGESERGMHYMPYGSGLETIDICESIFGYWPCLAKIEQQKKQKQMNNYYEFMEERRMDPWKSAADYLFGGPEAEAEAEAEAVTYDYENYHHHNQKQAQYEYHSWLQ